MFSGSGFGGRFQGGTRNRFGNLQRVVRLNLPKNAKGEGLMQAYCEIGGHLYRFTVTRAKTRKSDRHVGWLNVERMENRTAGEKL